MYSTIRAMPLSGAGRPFSQTAGLIGEKELIEVGGVHFIISNEDILMFDGNSATSLLHNRLRKRFATTLNEDARTRLRCG